MPLAKILGVTTDYLLSGNNEFNKYNIDDLLFSNCIVDGILDIGKLLSMNNINYLKKGLKEYPIHRIEKFYDMIYNEQWNEIYRYSINVGNHSLTQCFVDGNIEAVERTIINEFWNKDISDDWGASKFNGINGEYIFSGGNINVIKIQTVNDIKTYLDNCKKTIFKKYKSKEKFLAEKDIVYFRNELSKGYPEQVIKELGERLEFVLKYKYPKLEYIGQSFSAYCEEIGLKNKSYDVDQHKNEPIVNLMITFIKCHEEIK